MRELTKAEREALEDTWQSIKSHSSADRISMRVGFIAGLEYQDKRIEALEEAIMTVIRDAMARPGAYLYADIDVLRYAINEVTK